MDNITATCGSETTLSTDNRFEIEKSDYFWPRKVLSLFGSLKS